MKKLTYNNSQVALVRFDRGSGFAGEPFVYVKRRRFFKSKAAAKAYNKAIWDKMRCPNFFGEPNYPFVMVTKGTESWLMTHPQGWMEEPSVEEIIEYAR